MNSTQRFSKFDYASALREGVRSMKSCLRDEEGLYLHVSLAVGENMNMKTGTPGHFGKYECGNDSTRKNYRFKMFLKE